MGSTSQGLSVGLVLKVAKQGSNGDQTTQDQPLVHLCCDSIIVLSVKRGGCEMLLEYWALSFLLSTLASGLYPCQKSFTKGKGIGKVFEKSWQFV